MTDKSKAQVAELDLYPTTHTALREVLGLLNVFTAMTPHLSRVLAPAFDVVAGKGKLSLAPAQREALSAALKLAVQLVLHSPGLSAVDWERRFVLRVDGSSHGFGATLMQWRSTRREDGLVYIAFGSARASAPDRHRSASVLELKVERWESAVIEVQRG